MSLKIFAQLVTKHLDWPIPIQWPYFIFVISSARIFFIHVVLGEAIPYNLLSIDHHNKNNLPNKCRSQLDISHMVGLNQRGVKGCFHNVKKTTICFPSEVSFFQRWNFCPRQSQMIYHLRWEYKIAPSCMSVYLHTNVEQAFGFVWEAKWHAFLVGFYISVHYKDHYTSYRQWKVQRKLWWMLRLLKTQTEYFLENSKFLRN